ncbi:MAG: ATP synthase subunit I [Eubacteriales bacterium]|nr:ATP synthase subunit I [Eubacteriales bacterium]
MVKPDPAIRKIILRAIAFNLIMLGIWAVVFKDSMPWIRGQILGGAIGVLLFLQMKRTLEKALVKAPQAANATVRRGYLIRLLIYGVVFGLSLLSPEVQLISVILGVISLKYTVMISGIFDRELLGDKSLLEPKEEAETELGNSELETEDD